MRLGAEDAGALITAMKKAFDAAALKVLLAERGGGVELEQVSNGLLPLPVQIVDVVRAFQQRSETELLVAAVKDARPRIGEFCRLNDLLELTDTPGLNRFQVVILDQSNPFADVAVFRTRLAEREAQVCRVEIGERGARGFGSGVLISPDLVLTNHHVVASAIKPDGLKHGIQCRFDFRVSADGHQIFPGRTFSVKEIVQASEPSPGDRTGADPGNDADRLDYALLRLDEDAASTSAIQGGPARGATPIRNGNGIAPPNIGLVLQHPDGRPLKIALGSITRRRRDRLVHNISTEQGSSGSPLLDGSLELAALHHAGIDWPEAPSPENRAIPINLIVAHARAAGVAF